METPDFKQGDVTVEESDEIEDIDELLDIHFAIVNDEVERLDELCKTAKNLNGKFQDDLDPQHLNMTPLALASALNKTELVKVLLKNGAKVDATFANLKTTALMTSSFHGHDQVVKILLQYGANVKLTDVQQSTALGYCFGGSRNLEVIQDLLAAGVDVNISNVLGMNAFLLVSGYGNETLLKLVLNSGARVGDAVNNFGHTPLHLTVLGKQSQINLLTKRGLYNSAYYGLDRKNLKTIFLKWVKDNQDQFLGKTTTSSSQFEKAGQFLEDLGAKISSGIRLFNEDEFLSEEEIMKQKIDAVMKIRREKLANQSSNKRSSKIIDSFLTCGGKLGKHGKTAAKASNILDSNRPTVEPQCLSEEKEVEVQIICTNFAKTVKMLVDAGCKIDETEYTFGLTPLDIAIINGDVESTAILLNAGADQDHLMRVLTMTELYGSISAEKPDKKLIKDILDHDPYLDVNDCFENVNIPTRLSESQLEDMMGDNGLTPLAVAAKAQDGSTVEVIKMLIKRGADINKVGKGGRTALGEACRWGNVKMVDFLINQGADLEHRNPAFQDATPLNIAVQSKQLKVAEYLISKGAIVDHTMTNGRTSLITAKDFDDMPMIDLLLQADVNNNFSDKNGLMYQLAKQYNSPSKDIRVILESIAQEANRIKAEEDRVKMDLELKKAEKLQEDMKKMSNLENHNTDIITNKSRKIKKTINIGETDIVANTVPNVNIPKIKKKKSKNVEIAQPQLEVDNLVEEPIVAQRSGNVKAEIPPPGKEDNFPIYSTVNKLKSVVTESNAVGNITNAAVGMLEQNTEKISNVIAGGAAKVFGDDKKQTIKEVAQPVVQTAIGFAKNLKTSNKTSVRDEEDKDNSDLPSVEPIADGKANVDPFPKGVPIGGANSLSTEGKVSFDAKNPNDFDVETEISNALKDITSLGQENINIEDVGLEELNVQAKGTKSKKKNHQIINNNPYEEISVETFVSKSENTVNSTVPVNLDSIDSVIVKSKAKKKPKTPSDAGHSISAVENVENLISEPAIVETVTTEHKKKKKSHKTDSVISGNIGGEGLSLEINADDGFVPNLEAPVVPKVRKSKSQKQAM